MLTLGKVTLERLRRRSDVLVRVAAFRAWSPRSACSTANRQHVPARQVAQWPGSLGRSYRQLPFWPETEIASAESGKE
jgi:hypothetical protein